MPPEASRKPGTQWKHGIFQVLRGEDEGLTRRLVNYWWMGNSARGKSCSHGSGEGSWAPSLLCLLCLISYKLVIRKMVLIIWLLPPEAAGFEQVP